MHYFNDILKNYKGLLVMKISPFTLERYYAEYEFSIKYQMSSSDCDALTIDEVLDLVSDEEKKMFYNLHLGYTESLGNPQLRELIAGMYKGITKDEVIIMAPEEGIFLTLNAYLNKGDHVIALYPLYQSHLSIPEAIGCNVTKWYLKNNNNKWEIDLNFLQNNITPQTKAIIINFPHNPTGFIPDKESYQEIIRIAKEKNILLFSDEMYWKLEHEASRSLDPVCQLYNNSATLFGLSKSFGLPGLRIGWIVTKNRELYNKIANLKDYTTICNSAPSEILAIFALKNADYLFNKNKAIIKENISLTRSLFDLHNNILNWNEPEGSSIIFPNFKNGKSAKIIAQELIKKMNICITPGNLFGMEEKYFRIGLGRTELKTSLEKFNEYLSKYL